MSRARRLHICSVVFPYDAVYVDFMLTEDHGPLNSAFDLAACFVHLDNDGEATPISVDASFWENMDPRFERGRMVSIIASDVDWPSWEMHPHGDELIYLLSGKMTLVLELDSNRLHPVELKIGEAAIVPRGVWHTADVPVPGQALYVTVGAETQNRPRVDPQ